MAEPKLCTLSCSDMVIGQKYTLTITRPSSSLSYEIYYSVRDRFEMLQTKTTADSVSWIPPKDLIRKIYNSDHAPVTFTIYTLDGFNCLGTTTKTVDLKVPPDVIPDILDLSVTSTNSAEFYSWNLFIQSKTKLLVDICSFSGVEGSSIVGYDIKGDGYHSTTKELYTGYLAHSGDITFTATITDTRGRKSKPFSRTIHVVPYKPPVFSKCTAVRCLADGTPNDEGTCILAEAAFSYSDCEDHNSVDTSVFYRQTGTEEWTSTRGSFRSGEPFVFGESNLTSDKSYEVRLTLTDAFSSVDWVTIISTASVLMDFKAGGDGVAIGKVSEYDKALEVSPAWNAYFHGKEIQDLIKGLIASYTSPVLLKAYPVGSIYLSVNSTNPASLFGGTWEQISQGRFLLGQSSSYAVNATGGEATHKLTTSEMPAHGHPIHIVQSNTEASGYGLTSSASFANRVMVQSSTNSINTNAAGSGGAHNNMPPYLVCYMWKRIK